MILVILKEYGLSWLFFRILYSAKLKFMVLCPGSEKLFEKKVNVRRTDIYSPNVKSIEEYLKKLPSKQKEEIINIADNAIEGRIWGFSSSYLDYGNPINWQLNPVTGVNVDKNEKWYRIKDFDATRGDMKVIWEASRFTHFFYFARAFMLTGDKKYYRAFSCQLRDWLNNNSYSYGANYKCGQEATIRMLSAIIVHSVFREVGVITQEDDLNLVKLISESYKKVISNFFYAHKCIKNNHTISEIVGIIVGSWCCEDNRRLEKAYSLLNKEIEAQFFSDGGYIQYSFNYQRLVMQLLEFVICTSNKCYYKMPEKILEKLTKSCQMMYQLQDYTGLMPNYGSNDGALIFPVTCCDYRDYRHITNSLFVGILGERLYEDGYYDEEVLWFFRDDIESLPISSIQKKPNNYPDTGLYVIRHDRGFLMVILQNYKSRPAHMDQLHIDLWHEGINVLCDCGTYSYATKEGKFLASTASHNVAKLEGLEQMNKKEPFLTYNRTSASQIKATENRFSATIHSKSGYYHRREVAKQDDGYLIADLVTGKASGGKLLFHTPCDIKLASGEACLYEKGKLIAKVVTDNTIEIAEGIRSSYYMKKENVNILRINFNDKERVITKIVLSD